MAKINPLKIGFGSFFTLLGLYLVFGFGGEVISVLGGIFCIALGIGILASNR